jgi:hypothetical protein
MFNGMRTILKMNLDAIVVFLFMFCVFFFIVFFAVSDMSDHAYFAREMLKEGKLFLNNFLMYFLINLFSGFSGTIHSTKAALVLLLSVSNTAKYIIVKRAFREWCHSKQAKVAALALLFVFVVPILFFLHFLGWCSNEDTMYLGYCVPNVWHNSTTLCMMPFAILTYVLSVKQFEDYDKARNGLISLYVVLGTLIKPSFFFVYAVAYPIFMFAKFGVRKEFFFSVVPIICGCICVLYEYLSIYVPSATADVVAESSSSVAIDIMPLFTIEFWKTRWLKLMISMILPIAFVIAYWKEIVKSREFWFVLIMLVMALGIYWCCHETGPRADHGNFGWQVISSMWFVYYYVLKTIVICDNECDADGFHLKKRGKVFLGIYSIHVLIGLFYLIRYFVTGIYY